LVKILSGERKAPVRTKSEKRRFLAGRHTFGKERPGRRDGGAARTPGNIHKGQGKKAMKF